CAGVFFHRELAARSAARLVGNVRASHHHRAARFALTRCRTPAQAGAVAVANAFAWNVGVIETDARPNRAYPGIPAERCLSQSDRNRPDTLARLYHAATLAGMGHLGRSGAQRANGPCRLICGNVV